MKRLRWKPTEHVVVGVDQSARGTAAVALRYGRLSAQVFFAYTKKQAKEHADEGALEPAPGKTRDEAGRIARLARIEAEVWNFVARVGASHVALEDHAFAGKAYVRNLAEVGGVLRLALWRGGVPFRSYLPEAVKIFATGKGNADKSDVLDACEEIWTADFRRFGGRDEDAPGNLADAFVLANLLQTELHVRSGAVSLDVLPERERRVFLRTTRTQPVNLLDVPFVARGNPR